MAWAVLYVVGAVGDGLDCGGVHGGGGVLGGVVAHWWVDWSRRSGGSSVSSMSVGAVVGNGGGNSGQGREGDDVLHFDFWWRLVGETGIKLKVLGKYIKDY